MRSISPALAGACLLCSGAAAAQDRIPTQNEPTREGLQPLPPSGGQGFEVEMGLAPAVIRYDLGGAGETNFGGEMHVEVVHSLWPSISILAALDLGVTPLQGYGTLGGFGYVGLGVKIARALPVDLSLGLGAGDAIVSGSGTSRDTQGFGAFVHLGRKLSQRWALQGGAGLILFGNSQRAASFSIGIALVQ